MRIIERRAAAGHELRPAEPPPIWRGGAETRALASRLHLVSPPSSGAGDGERQGQSEGSGEGSGGGDGDDNGGQRAKEKIKKMIDDFRVKPKRAEKGQKILEELKNAGANAADIAKEFAKIPLRWATGPI